MPVASRVFTTEVLTFIEKEVQKNVIYPIGLDIGAGFGFWGRLLKENSIISMDAIEVFEPYVNEFGLRATYDHVFVGEAIHVLETLSYMRDVHYDFAILGDVLEHFSVKDAQKLLKLLTNKVDHIIVLVPFMMKQDAVYNNPYEEHLQDDLDQYTMAERYPMLRVRVIKPAEGGDVLIAMYTWSAGQELQGYG